MGAVPAHCWKEFAEVPHPMPPMHIPTRCRLHTHTPQRHSELCHLWHAVDRVAQVSSPLVRPVAPLTAVHLACVATQRTRSQSHLLGRVGKWDICGLNVNWLGLGCDLGVWHSIIKGTLFRAFIQQTPRPERTGIPFIPVFAEQSRFLWVLKKSVLLSRKMRIGTLNVRGFSKS